MKTIAYPVQYEWTIKKSRFITNLYPVFSLEDVDNYIKQVKQKYDKATHHCLAYQIDELIKVSDDKEPSGTAGMPIYQVLKHHDLNYILCIVTRYFGGIKLGSGGLVRAYTKSVTEALKEALIIESKKKTTWSFKIPYPFQKQVDYLLKDEVILNKSFDDLITYQIMTDVDKKEQIKKDISKYTKNAN